MVNPLDFYKRIEKIIQYNQLNATSFAEKIGVQRSSISHLLSGRNKPSLDFVLKIVESFPEVDLHWLLLGKGKFPIEENNNNTSPTPLPLSETGLLNNELKKDYQKVVDETKNNEIEEIIFFYKNGTFKSFKSN